MHQQVKHSRILYSAHTVFMCFVFISEQMMTFSPYTINWLYMNIVKSFEHNEMSSMKNK